MDESPDDSFNASRAEVFEALGHPTRVRILRAVGERPFGFAELKRKIGIESSGLLSFHLGKMAGLVKPGPDGAYSLTDEGKEALRVVDASRDEPERKRSHGKRLMMMSPNTQKVILVALVIGIIFFATVALFQQQEIANQSSVISSQSSVVSSLSSEILSPTSQMQVDVNVLKYGAYAHPLFDITVNNTGGTPINSISVIAIISGQGGSNATQTCFRGTESLSITPGTVLGVQNALSCGGVGDLVVFTITAQFLGRSGTSYRTATIPASVLPAPVAPTAIFEGKDLGVRSWFLPDPFALAMPLASQSDYRWITVITNEAHSPITSITATFSGGEFGLSDSFSLFVILADNTTFAGPVYPFPPFEEYPSNTTIVGQLSYPNLSASPLAFGSSCIGQSGVLLPASSSTGQLFSAELTVVYANYTSSTISVPVVAW